jgi:hypothetical protein
MDVGLGRSRRDCDVSQNLVRAQPRKMVEDLRGHNQLVGGRGR